MSDRQLVLVTGGSSGIGKEIARLYLRRGAEVILTADGASKLMAAEQELASEGGRVSSVVCDIGDPRSVVDMSEQVLARYGCPDVLVNNAGFVTYRLFEETPPEEIERLVSVNLLGHLRCARAFTPYMIRRRSGTIVNMASIAGQIGMAPNGLYSAAKHGLVAWSETLRHELHRFGIDVIVVCPGRVPTALFDHETFRARKAGPETRQLVSASEVARATLRAVDRGQSMVHVPNYFGLMVWANGLIPPLSRWLVGGLIRRRAEEIYERKAAAPSEWVAS